MLHFLPAPLLFVFNVTMISVVTAILAIPVFVLALVRLILPFKPVLDFVDAINQIVFRLWIANNAMLINLTNRIEWDVQGADIEKIKGSCFIIANHVTWTDIVMLGHIFRGKIPITKFFLKHSLIYIPILGQACYSLGMPFLRRYSRNEMLKNPKLKTKDIEATRKACHSLLFHPSTLVNFVEGTRYTKEKAAAQKSPYRHLMPPKAAGLAIALGLIGERIDCLLNTTLIYPGEHKGSIFVEMLCGRLKNFTARVEVIDQATIKEHLVGDYLHDKQFKHAFTMYLRDLWQRKDQQIAESLGEDYSAESTEANAATTSAPTLVQGQGQVQDQAQYQANATVADTKSANDAASATDDKEAQPEAKAKELEEA